MIVNGFDMIQPHPKDVAPPNKVETLKLLTEKDAETLLGADFGAFLEVQKRVEKSVDIRWHY